MSEATYTIWTSGAAPAGIGADFFVEFAESLDFEVQRFEVNGEALLVEIERNENKTLVIGRKYNEPDFENPNRETPAFYHEEKYSGFLEIQVDDKEITIPVSSFEKSENPNKNM